jgi:hypothetical protein
MFHAGRDETLAEARRMYNVLREVSGLTPYERQESARSLDDYLESLDEVRYALLVDFVRGYRNVLDMVVRNRSLHEATITVLAVERFRAEHQDVPEKLEDLVAAGYLEEIPDDPYSNGDLVYAVREDGFVLYSVSLNLQDDNATVGRDLRGRVRCWTGNGDAVFWPPK